MAPASTPVVLTRRMSIPSIRIASSRPSVAPAIESRILKTGELIKASRQAITVTPSPKPAVSQRLTEVPSSRPWNQSVTSVAVMLLIPLSRLLMAAANSPARISPVMPKPPA